ncbi:MULTISPECIES: hypothetical protein [Anaerotruncus]|jgi:hypothetical protein|uniref:hypothetical protein n=1 Tax=Anaerotruncus TaxID=244127 RepID=UPI002171C139|nr:MULTISPECIES: hypothetical protein [Anaerotruncus]MCI8491938.1 YcxB family protein [Anaerotruncus sp.]
MNGGPAEGLTGRQLDKADAQPAENRTLHIVFQTRYDDVMKALEVYDKKNKIDMHRNMEILGVFVVLWMFVPYAFEDPRQIVSWIMIAAALALLGFILFYPKHVNQKAAAAREAGSPEYVLDINEDGIDVAEGGAHYYIAFSGAVNVYDYENVYAVAFEKGRVFGIPKNQLDGDTQDCLCALLRQALGDRFEKVYSVAERRAMAKAGRL